MKEYNKPVETKNVLEQPVESVEPVKEELNSTQKRFVTMFKKLSEEEQQKILDVIL
jgi:hypothetical protein